MNLAQHAIPRPQADEYAPYFAQYLAKLPSGELLEILEAQWEELGCLLEELDDEAADHRYAEGKWSVKEVLGHILDAERIFAYRLLRIARGDSTPLAGFDENAYVAAANFGARPLESILEEYDLVRGHTLSLLRSLDLACLARMGTSNGKPVSARALAWLIAGHEHHHMGVLKEKYLPSF
jgi:uncharacterized damage-inducible protein DinB